jgi:hypothetical protein
LVADRPALYRPGMPAKTSHAYVVRAYTSQEVNGVPVAMLYVACESSPELAMDAVRGVIPAEWRVEMTDYRLTRETIQSLGLHHGEARSLA